MGEIFGTGCGIVFENARLSYIGNELQKLPSIVSKVYGAKVEFLDLSYNNLTTLQGIENFIHLKELILDNNDLSDSITVPKIETLHTLSINKNKICNLELFLHKIQNNLPSLRYLSLLGNKACPNQLSDINKDEEDYKRYRYFVISQLPRLRFLDSTPVSSEEKEEAKRRGHLMNIVKPLQENNKNNECDKNSPNMKYTPLPQSRRQIGDHQGAYGKCRYRYSGKHSEGDDEPVIVTPDESELQGMTEEEKTRRREIWQQELAKIEEEIHTLRHVLQAKVRESQELKRKLGISVWKEFTEDLSQGVRNVKESNVYQNVEEKFNQLGKAVTDATIYQKTESVVKATAESTRSLIGGLTGGFTQKIGQLKNSESFRSFEEKVGSAYENMKTKVSSRSSSMQNFDDALREESMNRSNSITSPTIPEGKPLP